MYQIVIRYKEANKRWQESEALIIDESMLNQYGFTDSLAVSMIDGALMDKLDYLGRRTRRNPKAFGGLQASAQLSSRV